MTEDRERKSKSRQASVVQLVPRMAMLGPSEDDTLTMQKNLECLGWKSVYFNNARDLVGEHRNNPFHVLLADRLSYDRLAESISELKVFDLSRKIYFCLLDMGRETALILEEHGYQSSQFSRHNHGTGHIIHTIRNVRKDLVRVVIADDLPIIRIQIKMILPVLGFTLVGEASDGIEALRLCNALKPDVVTLDIDMPYRNGLEVLAEIRQSLPGTQAVMVSGRGTENNVIDAARKGIKHFLTKPVSRELLISSLRSAALESRPFNTIDL